jgi:hypothetical protein
MPICSLSRNNKMIRIITIPFSGMKEETMERIAEDMNLPYAYDIIEMDGSIYENLVKRNSQKLSSTEEKEQ